jgi:hypothetical protein
MPFFEKNVFKCLFSKKMLLNAFFSKKGIFFKKKSANTKVMQQKGL